MAGLLALFPGGASATGTVGTNAGFEDDDGNLAAASLLDWNSFGTPTAPTWSGTAPYRTTGTFTSNGWQVAGFEDAAASTTDTGFAGGQKQDNDCATLDPSKAPNKDDLNRIYIASKTVNVSNSPHVFLMLGWVRIPQNSVSASAHVGYEFNQANKTPALCGTNGPLARRVGGDMLVVYDFEGGADPPAIKLSRWLKTGEYTPAGAVCEVNTSSTATGCWGDTKILTTLNPVTAEGKTYYQDPKVVKPVPALTDALKPPGANNPGNAEFGEAGLDLTAAGIFAPGQCRTFGRALAVSRSSGQSEQASMADIVGPGAFTLTNCGNVTVTKTGNDGGSQAGAVFTLYNGANTSGTVVGTCTVQANGTCSPSFTDLAPGTYTIDETTVPSGYSKDASLPLTFTLAAGENKPLSFTNTALPGQVNVAKVDDDGDPVPGATFQLYSPAGVSNGAPTGSAVQGASCTTNQNGACTISNVTPGTYTIDETVVPAGYAKDPAFPQSVTVTNGGTATVNASDPRTFRIIALVCREYSNTLYSSAVTIDGTSAGNSETSAQLKTLVQTAVPTLTDAQAAALETALCGVTNGAAGGKQAGSHKADPIVIPTVTP